MRTLRICLQATLVTLAVTGLVYPLVMTGWPALLFRSRRAAAWSRTPRGEWSGPS
jgi:K+-transporting ATPase c subunit